MAETFTIKIPLGFEAPDFSLPDTIQGENINYAQIKGQKGTLVMFICNHCPYVLHVIDKLVAIANEYQPKGIGIVAISANDVENYPEDAPDKMKAFARERGFNFPYLYDETQETAKAYQAACTPDFNVFNAENKCVYRGQLDDSRPKNTQAVTGKDLRAALDAVLNGEPVSERQIPSSGCNIKWKVNNKNPLKPLL